jgi:hypothetical protein
MRILRGLGITIILIIVAIAAMVLGLMSAMYIASIWS